MEPSLKEIRELELCMNAKESSIARTCRGCDKLQHCDWCGEDFCGMTRLYEEDWGHDNEGNAYCPECLVVVTKNYPNLFEEEMNETN